MRFKQIVKITEETIIKDSDHGTFRLLSESDFSPYRENIGLVQIAFKPLTLRGLPESFIAALRGDGNQN